MNEVKNEILTREKSFWNGISDAEYIENHSALTSKPLGEKLFEVESEKHPGRTYVVDLLARTCTCQQYRYRGVVCKHIHAVEGNLPEQNFHYEEIY